MQIDSPAYDPPCCRSRLANRRLQLATFAAACVLLSSTPASCQPSPATSDAQLAGPASRLQQRPADQLRTLGELPYMEAEEFLQVAAECVDALSQIKLALLDDLCPDVQLTADAEEIAAGDPQEDPCYMASPLSDVSVNIAAPTGKMPEDLAAVCREQNAPVTDSRMHGGWAMFEKRWAATGMCHRPLYFEEVNAERYGYTPAPRLQPVISAARFVATIPALPYLMVARPSCRCIYTLGHYRPGDCVPYRWHRTPLRVGAGVVEAAVIVGLVALVP